MIRPHFIAKLGLERRADNGNTVGRGVWSDSKVRPYVRLIGGELVSGPAEHESYDGFLLAGDLGDEVPDEVA